MSDFNVVRNRYTKFDIKNFDEVLRFSNLLSTLRLQDGLNFNITITKNRKYGIVTNGDKITHVFEGNQQFENNDLYKCGNEFLENMHEGRIYEYLLVEFMDMDYSFSNNHIPFVNMKTFKVNPMNINCLSVYEIGHNNA